jgi:transposase InsO family protein
MQVTPQGYYSWLKTQSGVPDESEQYFLARIKDIHKRSRGNYGAPRIHAALVAEGLTINHKKVERLMKENGLRAKRKKKFKATTNSKHNKQISDDLLQRDFTPAEPNKAWVSDITYVWTDEGWLYLCTFIDLYSRLVVGWSMNSTMTSALVVDAFEMAKKNRNGQVAEIIHSDRGSQYASDAFRKVMKENGCDQSMSRKGNCWDNAVAESFFASLKLELVYLTRFRTRQEAISMIFDYIEVFYNRQRIHSTLSYKSPVQFENSTIIGAGAA